METLLTVSQYAKRIGVHPSSVRRALKRRLSTALRKSPDTRKRCLDVAEAHRLWNTEPTRRGNHD